MASGRGVDLSAGQPPPQAQAPSSTAQGAGEAFGGYVAQAAMNNPAVQQQLQQQAMTSAQQGFIAARDSLGQAAQEMHHWVQEGPAGISILCFLGGWATFIVGVIGLVSLNSSSLFHYVLNAYLTGFGMVAILLEADVEKCYSLKVIGKLAPFVERYQHDIFDRAKFLTELRGRGLFYIFVGTLSVTQCWWCLFFFIGVWNLIMGMLTLMMSFGINPVATGMETPLAQQQLYEPVPVHRP